MTLSLKGISIFLAKKDRRNEVKARILYILIQIETLNPLYFRKEAV